jgi:hypothetical protein
MKLRAFLVNEFNKTAPNISIMQVELDKKHQLIANPGFGPGWTNTVKH